MQGSEFRRLRERLGLTQAQVGERLGVSRHAVIDWEGGTRRRSGEPAEVPKLAELAIRFLATEAAVPTPEEKRHEHSR